METHRNRKSKEDDLKGRQPYRKRTLQEDRNNALQEEDINQRQSSSFRQFYSVLYTISVSGKGPR